MNCKFLSNGLALSYDQIITPCCVFKHKSWDHTIDNTDLNNWFNSSTISHLTQELASGKFPEQCIRCEQHESYDRGDSMRLNAKSSYGHYNKDDITLEIRPGNTCNFACQSCWPEASSRVSGYHKQAFGTTDIVSKRYTNFNFLNPISSRLRDIVLLGGEPFYDKNCLKFLQWMQEENLNANLTLFTNGSVIDWEFIKNYTGKITVVVSLDAIGMPAEYIRFGTEWQIVKENYEKLRDTKHINTRVNITTSAYNFPFIGELVEWLSEQWPEIVTFGRAAQPHLGENIVPKDLVPEIVKSLNTAVEKVKNSNIVLHQIQNTSGALNSIANKLVTDEYNEELHVSFINQATKLDMVKNMFGEDYDPYFKKITNKILTR